MNFILFCFLLNPKLFITTLGFQLTLKYFLACQL